MGQSRWLSMAIAVPILASAFLCTSFLSSQQGQVAESAHLLLTTPERLQTEDWWPTKSTFPLRSFAGSETCVQCHAEESSAVSPMKRAASLAVGAKFIKGDVSSFSAGPLTYKLTATANGIEYSVGKATQIFSHKLTWVMGAGELGRTFLYESDKRWYQSEATYYTHLSGLDITTGLGFDPNAALDIAFGQPLSPSDTRACFGCHTVHSTTSAGFDPGHAEAGLGCEACHGPAQAHVVSAKSGSASGARSSRVSGIFNPAKLSPADSIDFCGSCHRTFADASLSLGGQRSTAAVRFQPYRLEESKCWRATQSEKLTCVACHNPHEPLNRSAVAYDNKCLSCHAARGARSSAVDGAAAHSAKACPKATQNCTNCHMPKVNVVSMHGDFTDHFIRIVKAEDDFPR